MDLSWLPWVIGGFLAFDLLVVAIGWRSNHR